jgi:lysophospholipase L1-like esterase
MTILAIGDSFTFGAELPDVPKFLGTSGRHFWNDQTLELIDARPSQFAWPELLAKKLNQQVNNLSAVGGSNDRIFRLAVNESSLSCYDLVICAWTAVGRLDISHNGEECMVSSNVPVWPWVKAYYADHYNNLQEQQKWLSQLICLQSYFQQRNQKYIFVNALKNQIDSKYNYLVQQLDHRYFVNWHGSFQDWCKNTSRGTGGHFLEDGHRLVAERLYKFLSDADQFEQQYGVQVFS